MFYDLFSSKDDIIAEFQVSADELDNAVVLFAAYSYEDYSGDALVIYVKDGKFWWVSGGHCSCYGLEGQWSPDEMTLRELRHILTEGKGYGVQHEYSGEILKTLEAFEHLDTSVLTDDEIQMYLKLAVR